MAFTSINDPYDFNVLKAQLLISNLQQTNNPLYQLLNQLITNLNGYQKFVDNAISQIIFPPSGIAPTYGTFTPTINTTSGTGVGLTYSVQSGDYVKIDKFVYIRSRITLTNNGTLDGNIVVVQNLPFAIGKPGMSNAFYFANMGVNWTMITGLFNSGTDIQLYGNKVAAAGLSGIPGTDISNTTDFIFSGSYLTT